MLWSWIQRTAARTAGSRAPVYSGGRRGLFGMGGGHAPEGTSTTRRVAKRGAMLFAQATATWYVYGLCVDGVKTHVLQGTRFASSTSGSSGDSALGAEVARLRAPKTIPHADGKTPRPAYCGDTARPMHERMEALVLDQQGRLVAALESLDTSSKFVRDRWERDDGRGYGITCVLQDGAVLEKAGVNVSVIEGTLTPGQLKSMRDRNPQTAAVLRDNEEYEFRVAGISVVVHPRNPYAPTAHENFRRFEVHRKGDAAGKPLLAWFGGGADLTPAYLFDEDVGHFHGTLKTACDAHDPAYYPRFKAWCDRYFAIAHRGGETRGVGGIFFDDLEDKQPEDLFRFVYDASSAFVAAYVPLVARRMTAPYSQRHRDWQLVRRGHYAEFNLVYDRGTKFGLMTPGARIESILMSLPLTARWEYMNSPAPGSPEDALLQCVRTTRDWVAATK
ncbi:Coproporphyrinogen-III oxidase [Coemansia sp. RSA 1285]|nr:Coproporphyrinogen-III oxidase [Coemansia sp. RSA 1285]